MSGDTPLDINPVHVRTLQAIARSGSFSRAGETLHLSQPAISHHVRHLERELGVPLLIRRGRRASPTEAGALLLEHAGRAFEALDDARYQRDLGPATPTALVDGVRRTLDEFARLQGEGRLDARELA